MRKVLITMEEFKEIYSVNDRNFELLVASREIVPFKWGEQVFLNFPDVELHVCNLIMHAEMKAGLHIPTSKPR